MTNQTKQKAKDFTNSAENLCNPPEIKQKLDILHQTQEAITELEVALSEHWAWSQLKEKKELIDNLQAQIRSMVDAQGSYQDLDSESYAIKYRRMIRTYHADQFKESYPKYIPAVIEEAVNVKALEGLIKGQLISVEELRESGVIEEKPQFAYFIR